MRASLLSLVGALVLLACNGAAVQGSVGADTDTDTGTSSTTQDPTTSGGGACIPGMSSACACPNGGMGAQVCDAGGDAYGPCQCEGGSDSDGGSTTGTTTTDPGTTTTTGVDTTGAATTGAQTSTGPDTTTGSLCDDPGPEPNDLESDAVDLGDQSCNDDPNVFTGLLEGDADVDWFTYHGVYQDCGILASDPEAAQTLTADETVRLCVFAVCDMGPVEFECQDGASMSVSPDGRAGCCNQGDVDFVVNCTEESDESARIFIRIDQGPQDACVDYSVEYSYID